MENTGMKNKTLILGFTAGVLYLIWKIVVLSLNKQYEPWAGFPALVIVTGLAVFISITRFSENKLSFPDNFKAGARAALIAGLTAGLFVFIYYNWIDPEYLVVRIQEQLENGKAAGETADNLKKGEENLQNFFSPFWFATFTISGTAFFGMIFSLIVSALKRAFNVL